MCVEGVDNLFTPANQECQGRYGNDIERLDNTDPKGNVTCVVVLSKDVLNDKCHMCGTNTPPSSQKKKTKTCHPK